MVRQIDSIGCTGCLCVVNVCLKKLFSAHGIINYSDGFEDSLASYPSGFSFGCL